MRKEIIEIEQTNSGYNLTIDDWFIDSFRTIEKLLEYLDCRIRTDFN